MQDQVWLCWRVLNEPDQLAKTINMGEVMEGTRARSLPTTQNVVTEDLIGANRLWTAVIVKAVEDWRMGSLRARREAQKFLFEDDRDFYQVCASAGLDAELFRSKLLKLGRRIEMHGPYLNPIAA
jgi:hypothetical protein